MKSYYKTSLGELYCGDCLEIMKQFPDNHFDLCLTDPPYGINRDKGFEGQRGFGGKGKLIVHKSYDGDWDSERPDKIYFDEILRLGQNSMIFGGNYFADILPCGTHWVVWDKLNTMPTFSDCELVWTNSKRKSVMKFTVEYNGLVGKETIRQHPTQKPVAIIEKILIRYSEENQIIFDPYIGSGTTAVACEKLNRRWVGIEISEKYCAIAKQRIRAEANQGKLFK